MELENPYIVYVKLDDDNYYVLNVNSSAFLEDASGWTYVDEGFGDKYHHAQGNYFPKPIYTELGAYRYKMENGQVVECSEQEIFEQEQNIINSNAFVDPNEQKTKELEAALLVLLGATNL